MASCKITVIPVYSPNSDYDPNLIVLQDYDETLSSPTKFYHTVQSIPTAAYTLDLAQFTTVDFCYIKNLDTTNFVVVTLTTASGACVLKVPAGRSIVVPQVAVANDLLMDADTAACICEIVLAGT